MKNILCAGLAILFFAFVLPAQAATCYWYGGTGTWSTTNGANWSANSGNSPSAACAATGGVPKNSGDVAIFDANSGASAVVTVDGTMNGASIATIALGNFGGTLDFSVNNPSMTLTTAFQAGPSGSAGTRTLKLGSGTFTLTGANANIWDCTACSGLTLTPGTSVISLAPATNSGTAVFAGGGLTSYGTVTIAGHANNTWVQITGANTFSTLNVNGPTTLLFTGGLTNTITAALNVNGTASNPVLLIPPSSGNTFILTAPAGTVLNYAALEGVTFTNAATANNSFNLQHNSNITINGPTVGVIGGN